MLSRRSFFRTGLATGLVTMAGASRGAPGPRFAHGVASGDPLIDRVILWTRVTPTGNNDREVAEAEVQWDVASDPEFADIVRTGTALATSAADYIVKVDADGLDAGTSYFYRFRLGDAHSPTGRTRTLPVGTVEQLRIAVFSCSNLPYGYFNAYGQCAAREDIDLWLHLGDYIYEYGAGTYPAEGEQVAGRTIAPDHETIVLADYRARYARYRLDADLQAMHARAPLIAVWDDHELANDAWKNGAQNHQPESEGAWQARRLAAHKAYMEWMPVRQQPLGRLYRRFDWGQLASLIMLDTRLAGRDRQLDYASALGPAAQSGDPTVLATAVADFRSKALDAPDRSLLGQPQERWLEAQLREAKRQGSIWQVLGQQVLLGAQRLPANAPAYLDPRAPDWLHRLVRLNATLGGFGLPANLDAWGGYPAARAELLGQLHAHASNALVLAGDTHNAWAFNIPGGDSDNPLAVEIGVHSVTSPGYEGVVSAPISTVERAMRDANETLAWCDLSRRGYATVSLSPEQAQIEWVFMRTVREASHDVAGTVTGTVNVTPGVGVSPVRITRG